MHFYQRTKRSHSRFLMSINEATVLLRSKGFEIKDDLVRMNGEKRAEALGLPVVESRKYASGYMHMVRKHDVAALIDKARKEGTLKPKRVAHRVLAAKPKPMPKQRHRGEVLLFNDGYVPPVTIEYEEQNNNTPHDDSSIVAELQEIKSLLSTLVKIWEA